MTGLEATLIAAAANLFGMLVGKIWWEKKNIDTKFLPRNEHTLICANRWLEVKNEILRSEKRIVDAIKNNGSNPPPQPPEDTVDVQKP